MESHASFPHGPAPPMRLRARGALVSRTAVLTGFLGLVALALFVVTLGVGSTWIPPLDVTSALIGTSTDQGVNFVVLELRLPIAAAALCVGLALGVAGTLFQQLLDNPLASPELIGISEGASIAAVAGIVLFTWGGYAIPVAALAGAILGAALIYALAWRDGINGYRLILVGLGISELMLALISYMVARAEIRDAREAMHWLVGSIGQTGTAELRVLIAALVILVPMALLLHRSLRTLQLGDDAARALGMRVEAARLALLAVAVALVAFATAVAGPIAFVALVAGPIAQRILGPSSNAILAAAFVGAAVVLAADLVSQQVLPIALPTGVLTGAIGAPYLLWILATINRKGRGG